MIDSKNIIHGVPETGANLKNTYSEQTFQNLLNSGQEIAQINYGTGESITYRSILQQACNLATSLRKLGIKKGDVVCISSENRFEFSISVIAIMLIGAVNATLNILYSRHELLHVLNISKPNMVICSNLTLSHIIDMANKLPSIRRIIFLGDETQEPNVILYKDLIKEQININTFEITKVDMQDPLVILSSSGTTGLPKGVTLSHLNFAVVTAHLKNAYSSEKNELPSMTMLIIPWFHAFGFVTHLALLNLNMRYVFTTRFEEEPFLKALQDYKVTLTMLAPPLMVFLAKHPIVSKYDLSSLKTILCGGAPLSKNTQEAAIKRLGNCIIKQGYGLTEATLGVTHNPKGQPLKYGSSGKVLPGTRVKIIDIENGQTLGPRKTGELCFKGPTIMLGYYGNEAATKEMIDSDGWLHTGDIAYYDEDEYIFIVDRLKELIKYKGYQVPPAELEAMILQNPKVKDVGVVGLPDESAGELPLAFVVKQAGVNLSQKEIIDFVASNVSSQKHLRGGVIFVDEIPKNPSGKILRRELREKLKKIVTKSKL